MALNIKNPETEKMAHELAELTGETLTQAVTVALAERLERARGQRSAPDLFASLLAISCRCAALPVLDPRTPDEILGYNEQGIW